MTRTWHLFWQTVKTYTDVVSQSQDLAIWEYTKQTAHEEHSHEGSLVSMREMADGGNARACEFMASSTLIIGRCKQVQQIFHLGCLCLKVFSRVCLDPLGVGMSMTRILSSKSASNVGIQPETGSHRGHYARHILHEIRMPIKAG